MTLHTGRRADHLLAELEPSVARLLDRHLGAAREWMPHTYTPWSKATDYDGPLDGQPWQPEQSALPPAVRDAFIVNLLAEDNLPSYHFEIATRFGRDGAWGAWIHRWTAEEARHAEALRSYLHASRAIDPVELERLRMRTVQSGYAGVQPSIAHGIAYVTVQELANREAHRNTGAACGDRLGEQLTARIAADENLHMLFYRDLLADTIELTPDTAVTALADVICGFQMASAVIPGFQQRAQRIAAAGIYDLGIHREQVLLPLLRTLRIMTRTDLGPTGEQARDRIGHHLEHLATRAERFSRLYRRLQAVHARPAP
ncbi:acyl-ACP desaturase [Streptomyces sp. NPDC051567]|uniref:acyl-ACP desaturase n=1 Tax=Streptomyces sp. NPDC051567 TaxID=3365660 RepID=UPI0037B89938